MSDSESTITRSSISISNERKKRKNKMNATSSNNDMPAERSNRRHTSYFFRKDPNNNDVAYFIICERTSKKPYPYSRRGGSTSNLSCHLRDKHEITNLIF
ncbi:7348_t:CDS:1 [Funneliformis geosporum]|uniref:7348_t:CDS:1 n=1 Tax=Funneliformis geosporum TaxID=1117311 RepID=A0A9W4X2A8_9GLOM|nr:7348_t:CDS:1 [Funneliformis geosporum]